LTPRDKCYATPGSNRCPFAPKHGVVSTDIRPQFHPSLCSDFDTEPIDTQAIVVVGLLESSRLTIETIRQGRSQLIKMEPPASEYLSPR
jgi:hypothetical protein